MKSIRYIFLSLIVLLVASCNDVWEDHIKRDANVSDKTLAELIEGNSDFSEFSKYLQKSGYSADLATSKFYTVWVPDNQAMTSVDPDVFNDSIKLRTFVANHIVLNEYSIQKSEVTPVVFLKTLNGKNIQFNQNDSTIAGVKITQADLFAKNGILHRIGQFITPCLNIWEFIESYSESNQEISYLKSQSGTMFVPDVKYRLGYNASGKAIYDTSKCLVWFNTFFDKVADLRVEDSVYTFFVVDDNVYNSEFAVYNKYFKVDNGITRQDSLMTKLKITKDYIFSGAYTQPGNPQTLVSLSGVKVPFNSSSVLLYKASNGYIYKVNNCKVELTDKIPPIKIEGETDDKYILPLITTLGGNKRYKPEASGGYDFIFESNSNFNKGLAAADYADGTSNPNAGGIALHVKELASCKYRISWVAVNDFGSSLNSPTNTIFRQKLALSKILRMSGSQPTFNYATSLAYDSIKTTSYANAVEKELIILDNKRIMTDVYFLVLCGSTTATSTAATTMCLDYLKLEPIF